MNTTLNIDYIHQIFINSDNLMIKFPSAIEENIRLLKEYYPTATYKLWTVNEIETLMTMHFSTDVLESFHLLTPFAYKADLARLCILYVYGGLYIDLGKRLLEPLPLPKDTKIFAFQDIQNSTPIWFSVLNSVIWTVPKRLEIKLAIENIVNNCKNRIYGENPLYPTGPVVLGMAIVKVMLQQPNLQRNEFWIGRSEPNQFYTPDNKLVVITTDSISNNASLKTQFKSNSYDNLWRKKQIYGEKYTAYTYNDKQIIVGEGGQIESNSIVWNKSNSTMLLFGPYANFETGNYVINLELKEGSCGELLIEVGKNFGEINIINKIIDVTINKSISINLIEPAEKLEIRVYAQNNFEGGIKGYTIVEK